jgi:Leucine rich repeat
VNVLEFVDNTEISCEKVENYNFGDTVGMVKTCRMDATTSIEARNVKMKPFEKSALALSFVWNQKIAHLPIPVHDAYSSLINYFACGCSLKEVFKQNFAGSNKLKILQLHNNQIEQISSDTFSGLVSLEGLSLGKIFNFCFYIEISKY